MTYKMMITSFYMSNVYRIDFIRRSNISMWRSMSKLWILSFRRGLVLLPYYTFASVIYNNGRYITAINKCQNMKIFLKFNEPNVWYAPPKNGSHLNLNLKWGLCSLIMLCAANKTQMWPKLIQRCIVNT